MIRTRTLLPAFLLALLCALTLACNEGESGGSGGADPNDGVYDGTGTFSTDLTVRDLGSASPPVSDVCTGDVSVTIDSTATDVVTGAGSCLTTGNAATFTLIGAFTGPDTIAGEIVITFSAVQHTVSFTATISGDTLTATFVGTTPQVGSLVIDWDGSFTADK